MADDWEKSHIPISPDKILHNPKQTGWFRQNGEKVDHQKNGQNLLEDLNRSIQYCRRPEKIIEEEYLISIQTKAPISTVNDIFERFGMELCLQKNENSAIVTINEESLAKFEELLKIYTENSRRKTFFDRIESISTVKFNRINSNLINWLETSTSPEHVELEFLPNLKNERYTNLVSQLKEFINSQNDDVEGIRLQEKSAFIRGSIKPQTLKLIAQGVDSIWQTRQVPIISLEEPQNFPFDQDISQLENKSTNSNAKTVCVLDSGVDKNHPFLKNILVDDFDFSRSGSSFDNHGHGTFVAGLAAYGNFNDINPLPTAKIISAKIKEVGKNDCFLEDLLEEAVSKYHKEAKIFSLSVMYEQCGDVESPSELAYTIDELSAKYGVLFIICTGNIRHLDGLVKYSPYPTYFGNQTCTVFSGAESCNSVTVGGLAQKESNLSIAKKNQPSPFTRRGNLTTRYKPDVVSWAGNVEKQTLDGKIKVNGRQELSIISLGRSPSVFSYNVGTSFSAPIISNLAARILEKYPYASPNLLKALVIHFASRPSEHASLNANEELKKSLYGKGIPDYEKCVFSTPSSATYIVEDSIKYDQVASVPIYIPECMKEIYGTKKMHVTLVYDPPVDRSVQGYTLADLDFRLRKDKVTQRNWDRKYRNRWDNVKSDVFRWLKEGWGQDWELDIIPRTRFKERIDRPEQDFAAVITIEDPNQNLNIYDAILEERPNLSKKLIREEEPIATKPLEPSIQKATS